MSPLLLLILMSVLNSIFTEDPAWSYHRNGSVDDVLLLLLLLWAERQRVFIRVFSAYARVSLGC